MQDISYTSTDGKNHSYLIDFKVFESESEWYYLEVKGYEKPSDILKWEAVRKNSKLIVWFLSDIEKHENGV